MAKVLAALSGGVDSSVAAALLLEHGHEVIGCIGVMHQNMLDGADVQAAREIATQLGIPFHAVDMRDAFERHVVLPFCTSYRNGLTPSPCVDCNRFVKFGALQETMRTLGCSHIATGHYARIVQRESLFELHRAIDTRKDQSYMLARLSQNQLARTLFPLGDLTKDEVRQRASSLGLSNAERAESQDICFIPDGDYASFVAQRIRTAHDDFVVVADLAEPQCDPCAPGAFVSPDGTVLGEHRGIIHYTIGQRKGIGLAFGEPRYVCDIDAAANSVTIGTADDLLTHDVLVRDFSWIAGSPPASAFSCMAKIRYRQSEQAAHARVVRDELACEERSCGEPDRGKPARGGSACGGSVCGEPDRGGSVCGEPDRGGSACEERSDGIVHLRFADAQRAVTPGQYAVLYDDARVLGAGIITRFPR